MQQAECADSTARAAASGGKFEKTSAGKIAAYLTDVPIREIHAPSDDLAIALEKANTLLICISEMIEDAVNDIEKMGQVASWSAQRFRHLGSVASIAQDEILRGAAFHRALEGVVDAHIERRLA